MTTKHLKNPVTLTLELDDLTWMRNFLKDGRTSPRSTTRRSPAHTDGYPRHKASGRSATSTTDLSKVTDALTEILVADDAREEAAKRLASRRCPACRPSLTPTTKQGGERGNSTRFHRDGAADAVRRSNPGRARQSPGAQGADQRHAGCVLGIHQRGRTRDGRVVQNCPAACYRRRTKRARKRTKTRCA